MALSEAKDLCIFALGAEPDALRGATRAESRAPH